MEVSKMAKSNSFFRSWFASGEPWIWMNAAAVGLSISAVVGILLLIAVKGLAHFWPADVDLITYTTETAQVQQVFGEFVELDQVSVEQFLESGGNPQWVQPNAEIMDRWLVKTGNRKISAPDFRWIFVDQISQRTKPNSVIVLERIEWGNAYGVPTSLVTGADPSAPISGPTLVSALNQSIAAANNIRDQISDLEGGILNNINNRLERLRLEERGLLLKASEDTERLEEIDAEQAKLAAEYAVSERKLRSLYRELDQDELVITTADDIKIHVRVADILHAWQPNAMNAWQKTGQYFNNLWRFLSEDPREANTEGGVFPAIFGTVLMVLLMSLIVTPFGVIAAVYLREYAKQGLMVRIIRIAVNNLAGVPSIVYGVFGLGFFVYFLGGNLDQLFFPESLPAPTFGTPGLVWASLTLALLTVPVVIVSTEEGLTRIPRSVREGSMALGATQAETLFKVILPMASPAILTGVILAVARAAGEVAPLMLVGVVKLAPTLPIDGSFPYLHLDRKFMHLGFHIYDVGFQSPNVEAARPLVYATALLLVTLIVGLNLTAITLRGRLERLYRGVES
jgi:phosphate transport system permease protein|tara:strand:+ start:1095 stop:2798 length:1704 start_codon:yes stop_codon:yes gene_type:complete